MTVPGSAPWSSAPADEPGAAPTPTTTRYDRLGALGQGSMGSVYLGWDRWLGRNVALKVPVGPPGGPAEATLRREAMLAARLEHPAIAAIHDLGLDDDGRTFFVMRLVRGRPLAAVSPADRPAALRALRVAAEAIAHAHARGVVHRDLSPHNVLIGEHGEVAVIDWGLSADPHEPSPPRGGGTPGFVAPEQAAGAPPNPRADVWSLGALLRHVAGPDAPPELAAIVQRATAAPAERYTDAAALVADLVAWEDGRRVAAYTYRPVELLGRVVRAWRAPLALGAVALAVLVVQAARHTVEVGNERNRALDAEAVAKDALAQAVAEQALAAWRAGDDVLADRLATRALASADPPLAHGVRLATAGLPTVTVLEERALPPCPRWRLVGAGDVPLCLRPQGTPSGHPFDAPPWTFPHNVVDLADAGDGRLLLIDQFRTATLVDARTGVAIAFDARAGERVDPERAWRVTRDLVTPLEPDDAWVRCPGAIRAATDTPDGRAWSCDDGSVLRGTPGGAPVTLGPPSNDQIRPLVWAGGAVWGSTIRGDVLPFGAPRPALTFGEPIDALRPLSDGLRAIVVGAQGRVRLLDAVRGTWLLDLGPGHAGAVADGDTVTRIVDGTWQRARWPEAITRRTWRTSAGLGAVTWSADGQAVVVGDGAGRVARVPLRADADPRVLRWQTGVIKAIAAFADGREVAASMNTPELRAWTPGGEPEVLDVLGVDRYRRLVARPDGTLVGINYGESVWVHRGVGRVAIPPMLDARDLAVDGPDVLIAAVDGIWRLDPHDRLERIAEDEATHVARRGPTLAWAQSDRLTIRHGAATILVTHPAEVTDLLVLPDGRIATGATDGHLRVYTPAGALTALLPAHAGRLAAMALSPDGRALATVGWDGVVRMLGVASP